MRPSLFKEIDMRKNFDKSVITQTDGSKVPSVVLTDPVFASKIIAYFSPQFNIGDTFLDPCAGNDAFYNSLPNPKDRCEIRDGIDFMTYNKPANWIISNPPWKGSQYTGLAKHAFDLADHVVWLCRWDTLLGTGRRHRDYLESGHKLAEVVMCDWKEANFTFIDGTPKAPEGFLLCIAHFSKIHEGDCKLTYWTKYKKISRS